VPKLDSGRAGGKRAGDHRSPRRVGRVASPRMLKPANARPGPTMGPWSYDCGSAALMVGLEGTASPRLAAAVDRERRYSARASVPGLATPGSRSGAMKPVAWRWRTPRRNAVDFLLKWASARRRPRNWRAGPARALRGGRGWRVTPPPPLRTAARPRSSFPPSAVVPGHRVGVAGEHPVVHRLDPPCGGVADVGPAPRRAQPGVVPYQGGRLERSALALASARHGRLCQVGDQFRDQVASPTSDG
jgi:hypothetical protein